MAVPFIITGNSITVLINGKTLVAKTSHPNFGAIREYLKAGASDALKLADMFDIPAAISTATQGRVTVSNDTVFYDGKPMHTTLTARMLSMLAEGFSIDPLAKFLERLMQNPSHRAVNGLYDFLEASNIPITPEGTFLAYKKVRSDYYDIHSGTIRNAVGDTPRVERNEVDEDPDRTCSHGLHVCSAAYLPYFGRCNSSDHIMIVEVDPADVVAIPRDYNNAKMRCAGYKVIGEIAASEIETSFPDLVMSADDFADDDDDIWGDEEDDELTLGHEETDVIRNVYGQIVRFVFREDQDDWCHDASWVAIYTDPNGVEREYDTGVTSADILDEAIDEFTASCMEEVEEWAAEARWLDDNGNLCERMVIFTAPAEDQPFDEDIIEAIDDAPTDADIRVRHVRPIAGTRRWRFVEF